MKFGVGLSCFLGGGRLAGAKPLRPFVWAPLAVSFAVLAALLAIGYDALQVAREWLATLTPDWLDWLGDVLAPLFYVLGIIAAGWMLGFLAALLASPFLGALSASAEREAFGTGPGNDESLGLGLGALRTLAREGRKLAYHLPRLAAVFVLTLIPIVNVVAPFLWIAFGAWMLAVQFVDYAAENRGLEFRDTVALLRANRAAAFGFGAPVALLLAIPFAALVVIPAAVCGGAILWRRLT